jgi:hypothetical protein
MAAAWFALLVVPVALAGAAGDSGGPRASASTSVKKKVKKLTTRVKTLEAQLADLQGEQGASRPPSGNAGGDLTGSYPDPSIRGSAVNSAKVAPDSLTGNDIAGNAVGPGEIQDPVRSVNLPLGSLVDTTASGGVLDFVPSDGTSPDFVCVSCGFAPVTSSFQLRWDDDADGGGANIADTDFVSSTFAVPQDYAGGGSFAVRAAKDGNSGVDEELESGVTVNGGFQNSDAALITTAAIHSYVFVPNAVVYAPGDSVSVALGVNSGASGLQNTYNDQVDLYSIEFRYTATE